MIEMGTVRAARALGMDAQPRRVGAIAPGFWADLTVIPLDPTGPADPLDNILQSRTDPLRTCVAGRWI